MVLRHKVLKSRWNGEPVCYNHHHCEHYCWDFAKEGKCSQVRLELIKPEHIYEYQDKRFCSEICVNEWIKEKIERKNDDWLGNLAIIWVISLVFWPILITLNYFFNLPFESILAVSAAVFVMGGFIGIGLLDKMLNALFFIKMEEK